MRGSLSLVALAMAAAGAAAGAQPAPSNWPNAAECSNISPSLQRQCMTRRIETKERLLTQVYAQALAAARAGFLRWGRGDNRLDPRNVIQAHRDWQRFVTSNCTALGAFGGGSNSAISDRVAGCRERELDERITLYRAIADGSYGQ